MVSPRLPSRQCYCYYCQWWYYALLWLLSDQLTGAHLGWEQLDPNGHQRRLSATKVTSSTLQMSL